MQQYLELLKQIKEKGTYKPAAREGMPGAQSLFGYQFRHNLADGFPLLTTKEIFWKGVVVELLWFLKGDTNIKYLVDNGVNIWNEDAYQYYLKKCKESNLDIDISFEEFIDNIKNEVPGPNIGGPNGSIYILGDCGFQYGRVWRAWNGIENGIFSIKTDNLSEEQVEQFREAWIRERSNPGNLLVVGNSEVEIKPINKAVDQIKNLIHSLKNTPESRRHIVTAIDPAHDQDLALYWCHVMFQFNCRPLTVEQRKLLSSTTNLLSTENILEEHLQTYFDKLKIPKYYLDCQLYQRSADVVLGVPFNIASYALLTEILAKICNMIPGEFIHTFGDVHIYDNHKEAVEEQLSRTPTELPRLKIVDEGNDWAAISNLSFDLIEMLGVEDFQLENYNPQSKIKAKLSTGLK